MIRTQFTYNVQKDMYGKWSCTNKFVDTNTSIAASMMGNTILWWILSILGTVIFYFIISNQIEGMF